jgi:hypothetical protein
MDEHNVRGGLRRFASRWREPPYGVIIGAWLMVFTPISVRSCLRACLDLYENQWRNGPSGLDLAAADRTRRFLPASGAGPRCNRYLALSAVAY